MVANERGFTLVEMLIVLTIFFSLLMISSNLFFKVKNEVSLHVYSQQLQLLTYEAYAKALDTNQYMQVVCDPHTPYLYTAYDFDNRKYLYLPDHLTFSCDLNRDKFFTFKGGNRLKFAGTASLTDHQTNNTVRYNVQFTYGRFRQSQ